MVIIFSACLLGVGCRYDGTGCRSAAAEDIFKRRGGVALCPEELGGLPTRREPAFLRSDHRGVRAVTRGGVDVTDFFERARARTVRIARVIGASFAVFKEMSPSCGVRMVHHERELVAGAGITTVGLVELGVRVLSEEDIANGFEI